MAAIAGCGDNNRVGSEPDAPRPVDDAAVVDNDPSHIKLSDGEVRGSVAGASRQFLGIPYAKPPVGALRWRAPEKPDKWTVPLDATRFSKRCAQVESLILQNLGSTDEDCLYLNVWTPAEVPAAPLPVMIWIHGGGNVNGSTSEPVPFVNTGVFYSGQRLAERHGVIVVSINYRLGLFGFFSHPDLEAEGVFGNQGLLDQRLAMQWVHDNIAKFGGDPNVVTIFGESAGSQDVCFHVASPGSRGLFHRAIGQSGGCTTALRSRDDGKALAVDVATKLGCSDGALACLRAKSSADLMAAPAVTDRSGNGALPSFGPDVDGQFLTDQPRASFDAGEIAKVPYLLGSNADEGTLFVAASPIMNNDDYVIALGLRFGATTAAQVASLYPTRDFAGARPNPALAAFARVVGDSGLVCATYDTAVRAAAAGTSVYMYNFDVPVPDGVSSVYLGATHGSELTSVFGTSGAFTAEAMAVSDLMQRYWTNFAKTGDPNAGDDPAWAKLSADANVRINFATAGTTTLTDFRSVECTFWRAQYAKSF